MAASDGDANGNAVEGANNTTGYRTITITLGRALTSSETVTVPLTVVGATVTTDHTFGLQGTTQHRGNADHQRHPHGAEPGGGVRIRRIERNAAIDAR